MKRVNEIARRCLLHLSDLAGVALVGLMTITVVDVVGRWAGILYMRGIVEISTMTLILVAFLALPYSFVKGGHLLIDIATRGLPDRLNNRIDAFWHVVTGGFLAYVGWWVLKIALQAHEQSELTLDLELPTLIFKIPAAAGLWLSAVSSIVVGIGKFRQPRS